MGNADANFGMHSLLGRLAMRCLILKFFKSGQNESLLHQGRKVLGSGGMKQPTQVSN